MDIQLIGSIGYDITEDWFKEQLEAAAGQPVRLLINSGGGSVFAGMGIIAMIRDYSGIIEGVITGLAASMASAIAVSCQKLSAYEHSMGMVHLAATGVSGNEEDLERTRQVLQKIDMQLAEIYSKKTGISSIKILEMMRIETWMDSKELLKYGFIDEIINDVATDHRVSLPEAKSQFAAAYRQPTMQDIAAYLGTATTTGNDETAKLRAWTIADPDNTKLAEVVNTAIASGKSEASVLNELKEAVQNGGQSLTNEDIEAAKAVNMSIEDYKKAQGYFK